MHPSTRLKLASLFFAVVWTVGMVWFSGLLNAVNRPSPAQSPAMPGLA
jgi:hypothetical protein